MTLLPFTPSPDSTLNDLLQAIRDREARQVAAWEVEEARWRDRVTLSEGQIRMLQQEVRKLRDREGGMIAEIDRLRHVYDAQSDEAIRLADKVDELRGTVEELTVIKNSYAQQIMGLRDTVAERDAEIDTLRAMIAEEEK